MTADVEWEGDAVAQKMLKAEIKSINIVMSRAVLHARKNHTWISRSYTLEDSIGIAIKARKEGDGAAGIWGSKDVRYARVHELGSAALGYPDMNIPARPYLRPAADEKYPELADEIRKAFAK